MCTQKEGRVSNSRLRATAAGIETLTSKQPTLQLGRSPSPPKRPVTRRPLSPHSHVNDASHPPFSLFSLFLVLGLHLPSRLCT